MSRAQTSAHIPETIPALLAQASGAGITQSELGRAVGVSERTIQNWAAGQARPTGTKLYRLLDIQTIIALLRDAYTDQGIRIWLHSRNRNLGLRRPIEMLADDDYEAVLDEATSVAKAM